MARRGRFTSPNSGGQNLTALIASLLRQKNSDEEQALLNAYRSGTPYNGAVPSASDIQAFYERWASSSGYAPGSVEMQNIVQKQSDFNNEDIKRRYNALVSEFNNSDGANYADVINFLANVATTASDPNDLADYAAAVDSTTSAYLKYQGQALVRGEMTAKEYQRVTLDAISVLDPNSTTYKNAIYDAFSYEWQSESQKWQNRITAGTATQAQFASWANGFKSRIVDSGVKRGSDLYAAIDASISTARYATGDTTEQNRYNKRVSTLSDIFNTARIALGMNVSDTGLLGDTKSILSEIAQNPDVMGLFANYIDDNPGSIPQSLINLGVTTGDGLRTWYDEQIKTIASDAQQITARGGDASLDTVYAIARTSGAATSWDEFRIAASQHDRDVAAAQGKDHLIKYYDDQYRMYLNGEKSDRYGSRPDQVLLTEPQLAVVNNEINMMFGNDIAPDATTLTGLSTGTETSARDMANNNNQTAANAQAIASGQGVYRWNPDTQSNEFALRQGADPSKGSYQYIAFDRMPDGSIVAYVQSIKGIKALTSDGADNGWVFELPSGKMIGFVNGRAYNINQTPFVSADGFVIDDFTDIGQDTNGSLPLVDVSGLEVKPTTTTTRRGVDRGDGTTPTAPTIPAQDLIDAADAAAAVTSGLDPWAQGSVSSEIDSLRGKGSDIIVGDLSKLPPTPENLFKIAQASDTAAAAQYTTYVVNNPENYVAVEPGLYKLRDDIKKSQEEKIRQMRGVAIPGMTILPDTIDIRTQEMRDAKVQTIVKAAEPMIAGGYVGTSLNPESGTFFRNMPNAPTVTTEQPIFRTTGVPLEVAVPDSPKITVPSMPTLKPVPLQEITRPVRPMEIGNKPKAF